MLVFTAFLTFPDPDGLVAAAAREEGARARVGYALALRLVPLEQTDALPFSGCAGCALVVRIIYRLLPNSDVCIK